MRCYVGIGGNIDRDRHIPASVAALSRLFGPLTLSSVYESAPVGCSGAAFYNLAAGFNTDISAVEIVALLKQIEDAQGRVRGVSKSQGHTLDLDLLLYGDSVIDAGNLKIPRPDIERHAFVLEPLAEIAPDLLHPIKRISLQQLWRNFDKTGFIQKRIKPPWQAWPAPFCIGTA